MNADGADGTGGADGLETGDGFGTAGGFETVRAGALTTVQDLGRAGYAHLGVPRSGALDLAAHRLANRLLGNPETAATLETTLTGCAVRVRRAITAVVTGAPCPVTVDGRPAAWGQPVTVPGGAVLDVGSAAHGVRSYIGFAGGVEAAPELGSRATDLLSGLGPAPLRDGDRLALGAEREEQAERERRADRAFPDAAHWEAPPRELVLPFVPGPREEWFTGDALRTLVTGAYQVSAASNRIGLRLEGPALTRAREGELASEGMPLGAVQVPPEGRPVVFLADHPTTGGYPVIGVVPPRALSAAAQAPPGTPVRFTPARPGH